MAKDRALGVRLHKPSPEDWIVAEWAVVTSGAVVAHASARPPRTYSEAMALRHLYEAIATAAKENDVAKALVWEIEGKAKMNHSMRPRFRAEGSVLAALAAEGIPCSLVVWNQISSRTGASRQKSDYADADEVCGIAIDGADPQAVLVALAALKG